MGKNIPENSQPSAAAGNSFLRLANRTLLVALALLLPVLLFARLGHYALWDDEAVVALSAKGILRTGDTTAVLDHNIVAYHGGLLLNQLHDRSTPPLPAYVTAAMFATFGQHAWAARLPFAACGLICVAWLLWWAWKRSDPLTTALLLLGILGNVSLFLFFRQCRYYAPAILASVAITLLYLSYRGERRKLVGIALWSIVLFASNYLNWAVLYVCLAVDYFIWRRREVRLRAGDWAVVFLPQLLVCGAIFWIWNPFSTGNAGGYSVAGIVRRLTLITWTFRDLNRCEFGAGLLLLAAPLLYFRTRNVWLARGTVALATYVILASLVSPQVLDSSAKFASVRYFAPVIPLCIALGVMAIRAACGAARWLCWLLALVAFGTNLFNGGPLLWRGERSGIFFDGGPLNGSPLLWCGARSTIACYVGELIHPPPDPFTIAAKWINEHVGERQSIVVDWDYMVYPLMFHAPKAVYAWQLSHPPQEQFKQLDPIHFRRGRPPDYMIGFGPGAAWTLKGIQFLRRRGIQYEMADRLDVYWLDLYRPELFSRSFKPITNYDRNTEAVYVFRRKE